MSKIPETRQPDYGSFAERAEIANGIIEAMQKSPHWKSKPPHVKQSLIEIAGKMSRIVNGNHSKRDSWDDIGGYAHLGKGD